MVRKKAGMGERHFKILRYLIKFQEENGYPPSIRQIGESIGVNSTSLVDYYLNQLEEQKYIERDQHTSRSIRVINVPPEPTLAAAFETAGRMAVDVANSVLNIPVWGTIFASEPIPTNEERSTPEYTIEIARSLLPEREDISKLYALQVKGDSMIDAMINEGDIVIMKQATDANNGDMVAVWLEDTSETTLKFFYREKDRFRLQPANPTMGPIYIEKQRPLRIQGKVVMVIRQLDRMRPLTTRRVGPLAA
ncbi:MAG: transcriptional repressor LexA [Anaerolineae bacterium]|nr:transcriptional repressor LexA [Anaerolineae bacterium]